MQVYLIFLFFIAKEKNCWEWIFLKGLHKTYQNNTRKYWWNERYFLIDLTKHSWKYIKILIILWENIYLKFYFIWISKIFFRKLKPIMIAIIVLYFLIKKEFLNIVPTLGMLALEPKKSYPTFKNSIDFGQIKIFCSIPKSILLSSMSLKMIMIKNKNISLKIS